MNKIWICVLLACTAFAQEIKRPTADVDAGSVTALGCTGVHIPSGGMARAYDAAGESTGSIQYTAGSYQSQRYQTRIFKTWQTGSSYSSLALKVSASSNGWTTYVPSGSACVAYSKDAGATWTSLICDNDGFGWEKKTLTVTLPANQSLARLQVGVCTEGSRGSGSNVPANMDPLDGTPPGGDDVTVYDIWTSGTTSGAAAGTGSGSGQAHRGAVIVN